MFKNGVGSFFVKDKYVLIGYAGWGKFGSGASHSRDVKKITQSYLLLVNQSDSMMSTWARNCRHKSG